MPPPTLAEPLDRRQRYALVALVSDHSAAGSVRLTPAIPQQKGEWVSLVEALLFVGINWAAKAHAVCVLDPTDRKVASFTIAHTTAGFAQLLGRLGELGSNQEAVPIAIERPGGRLVDALLNAGHPVVPVKPTAIKAWRESEVPSGAKSDAGDAEVIAEYLRLKARRLRPEEPYSDETKALRTVSRTRTDIVAARMAATNQLAALLDAHWPGAKEVFADIASPIGVAFLTRYPTPASAANLGVKRMAAFCASLAYSDVAAPRGTAGADAQRSGRQYRPGSDSRRARSGARVCRCPGCVEHRDQESRPIGSNGRTEAINGRVEALRRNALGFRNLTHYRWRSLPHSGALHSLVNAL
jgi:hypothetical protein